MKKTENRCCGCSTEGYPCLGSSCANRNVTIYYCDNCKNESEVLYEYDGEELCLDCVEKRLEVVY